MCCLGGSIGMESVQAAVLGRGRYVHIQRTAKKDMASFDEGADMRDRRKSRGTGAAKIRGCYTVHTEKSSYRDSKRGSRSPIHFVNCTSFPKLAGLQACQNS